MEDALVKENVQRAPLAAAWLAAALAAAGAVLAVAAARDAALPAPLPRAASPLLFGAEAAYDHLLNLTAIGPRVAGSYENEVVAAGALAAAVRRAAAGAAPHHRVALDVHTAGGAFPLAFMDGMNHVYRDVTSVLARLSAARPARGALLLNCHYDTVPDSPGASDDGAGCAVLLEVLRALAAGAAVPHDVLFLFNGAEENVLQASHAFVTTHRWAADVRAFINVEACGAGGRELLFQAGPGDPWLLEAYAAAAPHPFASSVAQELFRSGLIPADTDFRIFRDFGRLSGVDLAWAANGYVYHTRLDTPERVGLASLQRAGDNVLALARAVLAGGRLAAPPERGAAPVFFDVLGAGVVTLRAPAAAALAAATLAALAAHALLTARRAAADLYVTRAEWARAVGRAAAAVLGAGAAGVGAAMGVALLLAAAGARLTFYSRPWLLAPLYAAPALAAAWGTLRRALRGAGRGWWRARAVHAAVLLLGGAALAAAAAAGLRSAFLLPLWALPAAAADAAVRRRAAGGMRAAAWAAAAAAPALQTAYLAASALRMLVPLAGRAGARALPADAVAAALVAALTLLGTAWALPLVAAARRPRALLAALWATSAVTAALVLLTPLGAPYSPERPQRLMVLHARRTEHAPGAGPPELLYWVPQLDDNTARTVAALPALAGARPASGAECDRWVWCGAPYFLPAASLVPRALVAPAPAPPLALLAANVSRAELAPGLAELTLEAAGAAHVVVLVAAAEGARVEAGPGGAPLEAPRWGARRVYFFLLHAARGGAWRLALRVRHAGGAAPVAQLSVAAHAQAGPRKLAPDHARLLAALPSWTAPTGWGVDLHLFTV